RSEVSVLRKPEPSPAPHADTTSSSASDTALLDADTPIPTGTAVVVAPGAMVNALYAENSVRPSHGMSLQPVGWKVVPVTVVPERFPFVDTDIGHGALAKSTPRSGEPPTTQPENAPPVRVAAAVQTEDEVVARETSHDVPLR